MLSYAKITSRLDPRLKFPAVAHRIVYIAPQRDDSDRAIFQVAVSGGSGSPACISVKDFELRHFPLLKFLLLKRLGIVFDDLGLYSGRRGQSRWKKFLAKVLGKERSA